MNRLLTGNLIRLRKTIVFWLSIVCAAIGPICRIIKHYYYGTQMDKYLYADSGFLLIGCDFFFDIAISVAISLFIGTDFSDNTIRNKLITGQSKTSVFIANLITSIVIAVGMYFTGVVVVCIGIPLLGGIKLPIGKLIMQMACAVVAVSVIAVFVCTVTMVIGNRAISIIVSMVSVIGLQFTASISWSNLLFYEEHGLTDTFLAKLDMSLYDWLPTCQIYQLTNIVEDIPKNIYLFPVYSTILILVVGTTGIIIFKKKNLK